MFETMWVSGSVSYYVMGGNPVSWNGDPAGTANGKVLIFRVGHRMENGLGLSSCLEFISALLGRIPG